MPQCSTKNTRLTLEMESAPGQALSCSSSWDEDDHDMDQALQAYLQTLEKPPAPEPPASPAAASQPALRQSFSTPLTTLRMLQAEPESTGAHSSTHSTVAPASPPSGLMPHQSPFAQSVAAAQQPMQQQATSTQQQRQVSRQMQSQDQAARVDLCCSSQGLHQSPFSSQTQLSTLNSPHSPAAAHGAVTLGGPMNRSSNALQPSLRKQMFSKSDRFGAHLYRDVGMPLGSCSSEPGAVPAAPRSLKPPEGAAPTRSGRATISGDTLDDSPCTSIDGRFSGGRRSRRASVLLPQLAAQLEGRTSQPSYVAISMRAQLTETAAPRYARATESSGRLLLKVDSGLGLRASVSGKLSVTSSNPGALVAAVSAGLARPTTSVPHPSFNHRVVV